MIIEFKYRKWTPPRSLTSLCGLLGVPQLLNERKRLALQASVKLPSCAGGQQLGELLCAHVKQLLKVDTPVRELAERSPLGRLHFGHAGQPVAREGWGELAKGAIGRRFATYAWSHDGLYPLNPHAGHERTNPKLQATG